MEATPSPAERKKAYKRNARKRSVPSNNVGITSDSEAEETKGDISGAMAPPPVPPAKKARRSPEVAMTPANDLEANPSGPVSGNADGSPIISKPSSRAGSIASSLKGTETQDDGRDDISVAESSKAHRKTEEERLQFFRSQPECREVEPHRAFCIGCDQWVPLNPSRAYVMRPWLIHRRDCRRNSLATKVTTNSPHMDGAPPEGSEGDDEVASAKQSTSEKSGRLKGEAERQAYLEGDPRAEEVRPYEVLCETCKKWVQLGNKTRFSLNHWRGHQKRCSGSIPSSRVATAERKLSLVNDSSATSFSTTSVRCKHCDATIALGGEGDYNLTKWEEHKASCPSSPQHEQVATRTDGIPATTSDASPGRSERSEDRPPLSVASTEATAVDTAGLIGSSKKRPREPDGDDGENRPHTRARTDVARPSGALDWLLLPFRSFVSGFKKGMGQSSPSPSVETMPT